MKMKKRFFAMFLALIMLLGIFPIASSASNIRESYPNSNESTWHCYSSSNIYKINPNTLGNCTWYAYGRALEKCGVKLSTSSWGHAGYWFGKAKAAGFSVGTEPRENSIICWGDAYGNGHVAFVEKVDGASVTWTESNWSGPKFKKYTSTHPWTYCNGIGKPFQGYIYLNSSSEPVPPPPPPAYSSVGAGDYNIINKASGKYLNAFATAGAAKSTTNICASNADNSAEQKFKIEALGSNKYLIRSLSNSNLFCVDIKTSSTNPASGTNVYLYSNTDFASKHWYFEDVGGGYYIIRSVLNANLVLSAVSYEARANVCVQSYTGSDLQKWQLVSLNSAPPVTSQPSTNASTVRESTFNIINKSSGKYLNAYAMPGQATVEKVTFGEGPMKAGIGSDVVASNSDGTMEQQWKIESNGNNQFFIRSCSNNGYYCVNAWSPENVVENNADVRLYKHNYTTSKLWYFESVGDGYYIIKNVMNSNVVLTAVNNEHRADVVVQNYTGNDLQKWKLVDLYPVETPTATYTTLDLNGYYNNEIIYDLCDMATADVYINGALVADDTNDFCADYPVGTNYEITDIKPANGYTYTGVYSGSLSGTLGTSIVWVYLKIEKNSDEFVSTEIDSEKAYTIVNKQANTYLNCFAGDAKVAPKTNVCASNGDNSNEQKFKIQPIGDGKYLIRSLSNANLYCVDVYTPSNVAEDGANVWMYHNTEYASKHWYFEDVGDGYYIIRNALNINLVLTAESNEHRANVVVKSYTGDELQKWKLCDVTSSSGIGESESQNENIQKLNNVMRKWINVEVPYSQNVNTSKTEIVDFNNPPATMDCSSFTSSLYLTVFGVNIGRNTRSQREKGAPVGIEKSKNKDYSDLMIGDLILFDWNLDGIPNHVGLYSGNGKFIHMTTSNVVIETALDSNVKYTRILTIRRIIQQDGSLWPWTYIEQGDSDILTATVASAAIENEDIPFEFDCDEQCINNIISGTPYGDILLNTDFAKMVVCNKTGGELLTLTRDFVTSEEYRAEELTVLSGTILKFYDNDGNLLFVAECNLEGMTDDTLYGDVNGDGLVDEMDAMVLMNFVNGRDIPNLDLVAGDSYKDGTNDEMDAMVIMNYANGLNIVIG